MRYRLINVDLSPYYFARMFRRATGESPHQCVLRQRLERAQWLLQTTTLPIVDIALQCGFANQSYLTTVFKRRFGLTPQRYRRQVQ
jgi:AraC family transcriptional regulator